MDNVCGLDYISIQLEILQVEGENRTLISFRSITNFTSFQLGFLPFPLKDAWRLIVYSFQIVSTHCLFSICSQFATPCIEVYTLS